LLALTVDETDEAFANVYSAAVSSENVLTEIPQRLLVGGAAIVATLGALALDLTQYQQFLLLLGAFFVPLFGVLLADWLLNGMHYSADDIFRGPAFRPGMIVSWLAGFMVYEWLAQTQGLGFWTDFLARLHPPESQIGASLPAFAVSLALGGLVSLAARRTGALALSREG
jgi:purine-cytosine permease-like protein